MVVIMNLFNNSIEEINKSSDFKKNILNPFLEKSKKYYPNSIVDFNSDKIDIILLNKFPENKYSFEYEEAISLIFNFLKTLIPKYNLSNIIFFENQEYGFNPSFKLKVSNSISSKELTNYSDELFKEVGEFAEFKGIEFILDDLSIILCR